MSWRVASETAMIWSALRLRCGLSLRWMKRRPALPVLVGPPAKIRAVAQSKVPNVQLLPDIAVNQASGKRDPSAPTRIVAIGVSTGGAPVLLPVIMKNWGSSAWNTWFTVQNTGMANADVQVSYAACTGVNQSKTGLKPNTSVTFAQSAEPMRYAGVTMCGIFILGLVVLPFAPETRGEPLPE